MPWVSWFPLSFVMDRQKGYWLTDKLENYNLRYRRDNYAYEFYDNISFIKFRMYNAYFSFKSKP